MSRRIIWASAGDILAGDGDRITLEQALEMHEAAVRKRELAFAAGEVERELFFSVIERQVAEAIRGASEWGRCARA